MVRFRFALAPREDDADPLIRAFQSESAEIWGAAQPFRLRLAVHILLATVALILAVTLVMPVDRVVTSVAGNIVTVEPTMVLQALDASLIKAINVKEGDRVAAGQALATLDPTFTTADIKSLQMQIASLDAQIARADAELAKRPFDPATGAAAQSGSYLALQKSYYLQRKAQFDAQMRSYDEQIAQAKETITKYRNDMARYDDRVKISQQIEQMRASLAASHVGSKLNLLVAVDNRVEMLRALENDRSALAESQHQLQTTIANRDAFVQQWFGQTSQELITARNARDTAREQLAKATRHGDLVQLDAPDDAVVFKLAKLSIGSVLKEGDPLIYLAPLRSPVQAEAHILARDVGFIRAGDKATVKLDAFNFIEHGTVTGTVSWISEGAFTQDDNGNSVEPYYKARIALDKPALKNVPANFRLMPGMTLTTDIQVGTRSLFMYMLRGVIRGVDEAMREP